MCGLRSLRNFEVRWKMALSWDIPKQKSFLLSGALPLTPRPGALPLGSRGRAFPQLRICHYTTGCMTQFKVKVKVNEVQKLWKWRISQSILSANILVAKLMTNYDTPRQYLNFNRTDCWCSSSYGLTWPSKLECPLTRSRPVVRYWVYFYLLAADCELCD